MEAALLRWNFAVPTRLSMLKRLRSLVSVALRSPCVSAPCISTHQTCDQEAMGFIPGWVAIKRLLLGWVTVYGQVNHLSIQPTTQVNSA